MNRPVVSVWQPMSTAPKNKSILVWHDHEADKGSLDGGKTLTPYACYIEYNGHYLKTGFAVAVWKEAFTENDDGMGTSHYPACWFLDDEYGVDEIPLNPLCWMPIPEVPERYIQEPYGKS